MPTISEVMKDHPYPQYGDFPTVVECDQARAQWFDDYRRRRAEGVPVVAGKANWSHGNAVDTLHGKVTIIEWDCGCLKHDNLWKHRCPYHLNEEPVYYHKNLF